MTTVLSLLKESALVLCEHVPTFPASSRTTPIAVAWRSACASLMAAGPLTEFLTGRQRLQQTAVSLADIRSFACYNAFFTRNALLLLSYPFHMRSRGDFYMGAWWTLWHNSTGPDIREEPLGGAGQHVISGQSRTARHRQFGILQRRPRLVVQSPAGLLGVESPRFQSGTRGPSLERAGHEATKDVASEIGPKASKPSVTEFRRKLFGPIHGHQTFRLTDILDAFQGIRALGMLRQLTAYDLLRLAELIESIKIEDKGIPISRQVGGVALRQVLDELRERLASSTMAPAQAASLLSRTGTKAGVSSKTEKSSRARRGDIESVRNQMKYLYRSRHSFSLEQRISRLEIWAAAMLREWNDCTSLLQSFLAECNGVKHWSIANCISRVLQLALVDNLPETVITVILNSFHFLEPALRLLSLKEKKSVDKTFGSARLSLRRAAYTALRSISLPVEWLQSKEDQWDFDRMRRACRLVLHDLLDREEVESTYAVYNYMVKKYSTRAHFGLRGRIACFLARKEAYQAAEAVFQDIVDKHAETNGPNTPMNPHDILVGLQIAAHQGQVERAEQYFQDLRRRPGWKVWRLEMNWLLHACAVKGRLAHMVQLFDAFFPLMPDGSRKNKPLRIHFTTMILGFARHRGLEEANEWLDALKKAGHVPDVFVYNILLAELATRRETAAVGAIFNQMSDAGIKPDSVSYIALINLYAKARDPVTAEAVLKRAISQGIKPDRQMLVRLINSHVEAASWKGVIRVFDYVISLPYRSLHLSIDLCNALLKAYVRIGAPHYTVRGIFSRLSTFDSVPNAATYGLVIQSAVDSRRMSEADRLFRDMLQYCGREPNDPENVIPLTILISGYLRLGQTEKARRIYEDMIAYNIQPSSATFTAIIRSHAAEGTEASIQMAENFLHDVLRHQPEARRAGEYLPPEQSITLLFAPLMRAYARAQQPAEVERLFAEMIETGGASTLTTLCFLLDVYRRTMDMEALEKVWEEMYRKAVELMNEPLVFPQTDGSNEEEASGSSRFGAYLAVGLSIYIDAQSRAGQHARVADVLMQMRQEHFIFTAHNWNHIAVAMLRAGEPERAFEVLERVILPYQRESERLVRERNLQPETPFVFDNQGSFILEDQPSSPTEDAPTAEGQLELDRTEVLTGAAAAQDRPSPARPLEFAGVPDEPESSAARARRTMRTERIVPRPGWDVMGEDEMLTPQDLAHSLHVLQQVSPAWHLWRPHVRTLSILQQFLTGGGDREQRMETSAVHDLGLSEGLTSEDRLDTIYREYPDAVRAVMQFMRRRRK